jgi:hypothetical protein
VTLGAPRLGSRLGERRDTRALQAILGPSARIASRRVLQRRRNRHSLAIELEGGGSVVLKYYWRSQLAASESAKLAVANGFAGVETPRLRGATRHHLVQDFVAGEALDALAKQGSGEARAALFARAAHVLASIHAVPRAAAASLPLAEPCAPARLEARLRRAWSEIETRGFAAWEKRQGSVPAAWRKACDERRLAKLVQELSAAPSACVLGHGDFQPRHVVRTPDDRLVVVDWLAMSLVTPWIELAHLLRWLSPAERERVVAAYLGEAQRRGLLREVAPARAAALAASALVHDHLIVAKHMVRKLAGAPQPGHVRAFAASLDALAAEAG